VKFYKYFILSLQDSIPFSAFPRLESWWKGDPNSKDLPASDVALDNSVSVLVNSTRLAELVSQNSPGLLEADRSQLSSEAAAPLRTLSSVQYFFLGGLTVLISLGFLYLAYRALLRSCGACRGWACWDAWIACFSCCWICSSGCWRCIGNIWDFCSCLGGCWVSPN
jgi:hypothetical protein